MGLFNSTVLEVAIGLIFVYLLLSILCTAANEWISAMTRRRGEMLRRAIHQLLEKQKIGASDDQAFLLEFYKHPLISSMIHDKNHPTYIAARTFTAVVTDILTAAKPGVVAFEELEAASKALPDGNVKKTVLALVQRSGGDMEKAQLAIEGWFNDAMDRVNGWYKRRTQLWTLIIALSLTLLANADTIHIVRQLASDPVLRAAVVEEAKVRAQKPRPTISVQYEDEDDPTNPTVTRNEGNELSHQERDLLGQLLGWNNNILHDRDGKVLGGRIWVERIIGWLLTMLALSLGAPFWFDLLNRVMNIRFAGKAPNEASKGPDKPDAKPTA